MAEYIDRERLKQCFHTNICGGNAYDELIDMQPTADVVEREKYERVLKLIAYLTQEHDKREAETTELRSKIKEAIEEIKNLRMYYPNEDYYDCKYQVLEILKRDIGE